VTYIGISNLLRAGRSGDRIPVGSEIFRTRPDRPWSPPNLLYGTGSFPGVKSGRGVTLTPNPLLVSWSRKSRAIPLLPLWAVRPVQSISACTRVHFTFFYTGISVLFDSVTEILYIICFFLKPPVLAVCTLLRPCLIKSITNRCTWKCFKSIWSVLSQCLQRTIRCVPECELNRHKHVTLVWVVEDDHFVTGSNGRQFEVRDPEPLQLPFPIWTLAAALQFCIIAFDNHRVRWKSLCSGRHIVSFAPV